ncbi:hypothetical protein F441_20881 [Phytophthora nicotianae CJ01A1]|uniref:Uncharacterized protein n=1 Tax=Phytophthora nicotianae CJ01A1 TaxID=1317063 RepID=W2VUT7_PHYNI|nr:hypothetical protein F441_20881 [Phytophthora nicotianae CJ01A1]
MADSHRPKVSTPSSIKAAYGVEGKAPRFTTSKNQQSPRNSTQTSVLPRIDRPQRPRASSSKSDGLSILLPRRRPPSKDAIPHGETSPAYHGEELGRPSTKAAWCTPRHPASELPTGSHLASFFAAPEGNSGYGDTSVSIATPLRLQSVEDSINANEERYRVDMEQLTSNNDKFLEISMSANQHLDQMYSQLPNISDAFDQTASALQSLSSDVATLHEQHENAKNDMENRFEAAMNNNAEEMVSLSEAHATEKAELVAAREREHEIEDQAFREKLEQLDEKYAEMEKKYLEELRELRQSAESRVKAFEASNRVEKEDWERSAKAALEDLQTKAQAELDELHFSTQAAYTELLQRSQAEYAELQQTSSDELSAVKKTLTAEILSIKENAATKLAALADRSERQLQEHRELSNETLEKLKHFYAKEREHLLEKAAEEITRLRMFEIDQSTRMEDRRCRETQALRDELETTKTDLKTQIEDLHRRYTSELEVLKATSKAEKHLLVQTHAEETESNRSAAAQELSQTIASYQDKLNSMAEAHAAEVARNKEEAAQAREALVAKYEFDLETLHNERAREKDALVLHYETELESLKQASREEHDKTVNLHEAQVMQLREAHSSRVLALEMAMREQNKQAEDTTREKDAELETRQERIDILKAREVALTERYEVHAELSLELVEQKNMALSELESEIWRLKQLNMKRDMMLDSTNRALKAAEEGLQVKANTILELTFVIKSRDDEIEKLRNALLDTVQTVNTKTEILELTTETLSSKAKELEATKNALRLESGKLSMVEESMNQKVGMLENSELKLESMRLNMENVRLEIKRMQMDMKLQLEHTEGEIELKNGEIRRLHGAQSELKQKNDFCQQTIERLEESLAFALRQGEEAQRRIELLRLETKQDAEDTKKVCDELLDKEQELVIMTRDKQTITAEKQRLEIQFNNLSQANRTLQEKVELHTMQAEEIQCQYQKLLKETLAENDERMRSEKYLHMLELSAAKDIIRHLEGVEGRLSDTTSRLETVMDEKQHLHAEIWTLNETLKKYEDTDRQLDAANQEIKMKDKLIQGKILELDGLNQQLCKTKDEAQCVLDVSRMEVEDWRGDLYRVMCSKDEMVQLNESLELSLSSLRVEKEQLMLSLGHEKREIVIRVEELQERIAGLRKEGARAASEISGLQHALSEKKKELEYLQENLGEQTTDTRKIKNALDTLNSAYIELQTQFAALSDQRLKENEENRIKVELLRQDLENKMKQCETLQQSLNIQRQEIDLLMVQHDKDVMQLTDGHHSEAVQLIESHRAQAAQMTEDHHAQVNKLKEESQNEVTRLTNHISNLLAEHQSEVSRLSGDGQREIERLKDAHQVVIDRLEDDLRHQVSELTVDRLSLITEQTEGHRTEVDRLTKDHLKEVEKLTEAHRVEVAQITANHEAQVERLTETNCGEIARMHEDHGVEIARLEEMRGNDVGLLAEAHREHRQISLLPEKDHRLESNHNVDECTSHPRVEKENQELLILLNDATDEMTRAVCANVLELMTLHVAHHHEIELLEQHATRPEQGLNKQLTESSHPPTQADHSKMDDILEQMRLRLTEAHLAKANELLERSRLEEEEHAASLATIREELSETSKSFKHAEGVITALKAEISDLQTQLQTSKRDESERTTTNVCNNRSDSGAGGEDWQGNADFAERCKNALELQDDDGTVMLDDIVDSIEQLMKILQHFQLLQPKLGSPRRQPTATDPPSTLKNKVIAVLSFVEELQLMADFAQNILSDESKNGGDPASNESSRASLEALRVQTRTPSHAPTFDELQIDVDTLVDDAMQEFDQNLCELSNEEEDRPQDPLSFFVSHDEKSSPPSPFLADPLMDISLVMSDYHRLLSQTSRWVAKSRQNEPQSRAFSVGSEISRLVREHCALLSLSRRLFKLNDPRQELVSLLEGVALLQRMTGRLALFQTNSTGDSDELNSFQNLKHSESATSLSNREIDSIESRSHPVLASIGDMAQHLQDYDYFLQQITLDEVRENQERNSPASINIEKLVQEINERVMIVEQTKELLGFQKPVEELPTFLVGAREVLRQTKQIRESSVCFKRSSLKSDSEVPEINASDEVAQTDSGIDAALSEMDAIIEDLRSYNSMLEWLKQVLPQPESVKSIADLKDCMKDDLTKIDALTVDKSHLMQDKETLKSALEQVEETRDHLMKEASQESKLLQELAAFEAQALLSPVEVVSTRIELVQALIKQQQRACDDAQQRRADMKSEVVFLRQHNLLSDEDDTDKEISLSLSARVEIYSRLLQAADRSRSEKTEVEASLKTEKNELESSLNLEIQRKTEKLESVKSELAQTRHEMDKASAEERAFLESKEVFSSILNVGDGAFCRIEVYQQLHDKMSLLLDDKRTAESCAARELDFLRANKLFPPSLEAVSDASMPTIPELSAVRLELFQRLVQTLAQLHQHEEDLTQENEFLQENKFGFDLQEPHKSRLAVYQTLLAGQNTLIEEKMEREVALESEKAFLASHGVPSFENPMEIYEEYIKARKQLADLSTELKEELRFLAENQLHCSGELTDDTANLTTPFASSFRLMIYQKFLQNESQVRESTQQMKENMEQQLYQQITDDECKIASLTARIERLEASSMWWQESAYASQQEWDHMLLEEEEKRRSLIRYHEDVMNQTAEDYARVLKEISKARDDALALATATHAEALEEVTKLHEKRLADELHKQAQQLEFATYAHAENEVRKQTTNTSDSSASPSITAAQTRAQLLEKFAKRDTTAINIVYKAIRLSTDILSAPGNRFEVSTDVTQSVLACVKELKALKEFLVQSLEQITMDDDHAPPPFTNAPYAKWMADAVTRATADKECAIDLALCFHREFMSFAEIQLLTRQEQVEKALTRVYDKLKTAAVNGGFTPDQEKLLALELEATREREARENMACKFRLNEEYYRKLLEERKEVEIAQAATVESLQEERKTLRLKLEKLEQQIQQQSVLPQFRPPSSKLYTPSPRSTLVSPQTPRVLKTATIPSAPMPMRPERPRGGGNAHKERFVNDLERETGQRHSTAARRINEWRARDEAIAETSGELEQDVRATHETVIESVIQAPATAPGSSLHNQELWYQGVRSIHYVSFFISIFLVPRQQLFRVEVFNSDTEQQQQTVYVTWTEMQTFLQDSRKAIRLGIVLPLDPEMASTIPPNVRAEIIDVLFERVRVYGEGTENILLGFE